MQRVQTLEIMDDPRLPPDELNRTCKELTRAHRWLGDIRAIIRALRQNPFPVRSVLDVGCGGGDILLEVHHRLGAEVIGVDLRPPEPNHPGVPILRADAVRAPLPPSDVAISLCLAHHLTEHEVIALIRNVGRSCRRFILLDLVRHPLPLTLFRLLLAPFLYPVNAYDGGVSIRRSYTPQELNRLVRTALAGSGARYRHSVAPFYARQVVDISYSI